MRVCLTEVHGQPTLAMALDGGWFDLTRAYQDYQELVYGVEVEELTSVRSLLDRDLLNMPFCCLMRDFVVETRSLPAYQLQEPMRFLPPLRPGKIVAIGRNYQEHAAEFDNPLPEEPLFFGKSPTACIGSGDAIIIEDWYGRVDFEGELALIIGMTGRHIREAEALDHVAGVTLANDVTAREMQRGDAAKGKPWWRGKNCDTFCPLGPAVTLLDGLPALEELSLTTRVNGQVRQQAAISDMIFSVPRLIAHVSRHMTLEVGDVMLTGTPSGVGPLEVGDVVEVEAQQIGLLRNPVSAPPAAKA